MMLDDDLRGRVRELRFEPAAGHLGPWQEFIAPFEVAAR
jgi:hypothetical protein